MYKKHNYREGALKVNEALEGETLEMKIDRIVNNKEPIKDGAPLIYTERNEGVKAGYNIKTDRFEIAVEAMDYVSKSATAKRDNKPQMTVVEDNGETEPVQGTN